MKVNITAEGNMEVVAENGLEAFALKTWATEAVCLGGEIDGSRILIDATLRTRCASEDKGCQKEEPESRPVGFNEIRRV